MHTRYIVVATALAIIVAIKLAPDFIAASAHAQSLDGFGVGPDLTGEYRLPGSLGPRGGLALPFDRFDPLKPKRPTPLQDPTSPITLPDPKPTGCPGGCNLHPVPPDFLPGIIVAGKPVFTPAEQIQLNNSPCNSAAQTLRERLLESSTYSQIKKASEAYDKDCFSPLETAIKLPFLNDLKVVTGSLSYRNSMNRRTIFCTALAISPATLVTARHCFYEKETGTALSRTALTANNAVAFEPFAGGNYRILQMHDATAVEPPGPIPHRSDFIFLSIMPMPTAIPKIRVATASVKDPLVIVGINSYVAGALQSASAGGGLSTALRWDDSIACVRTTGAQGCFLHGCQTTPQFSGAPLFSKIAGALVLVGVHIAGDDTQERCEEGVLTHGNIAIDVPAEVAAAIERGTP